MAREDRAAPLLEPTELRSALELRGEPPEYRSSARIDDMTSALCSLRISFNSGIDNVSCG